MEKPNEITNMVSIPNREIASVYKREIISHLMQVGAMGQATANKIAESLYALDYQKLQVGIGEYMKKSISFYDCSQLVIVNFQWLATMLLIFNALFQCSFSKFLESPLHCMFISSS